MKGAALWVLPYKVRAHGLVDYSYPFDWVIRSGSHPNAVDAALANITLSSCVHSMQSASCRSRNSLKRYKGDECLDVES